MGGVNYGMGRIMRRLLVALAIAMGLPLPALANASAALNLINRTGDLTVSLIDAASFSCAGSFSLSGGAIFSESRVEISANGALSLDRLSITAPLVQFLSLDGGIVIGDGVVINDGSLILGRDDGEVRVLPPHWAGSILVSGPQDSSTAWPPGNIDVVRGSDVEILVGGDISLASPVPEPDTFSAMLLGLLAVLPHARSRKRRPCTDSYPQSRIPAFS